jgi:hypothetical protein
MGTYVRDVGRPSVRRVPAGAQEWERLGRRSRRARTSAGLARGCAKARSPVQGEGVAEVRACGDALAQAVPHGELTATEGLRQSGDGPRESRGTKLIVDHPLARTPIAAPALGPIVRPMVGPTVDPRNDVACLERVLCGSGVAAAPAHRLLGERLASRLCVSVAQGRQRVFWTTGASSGEGASAHNARSHRKRQRGSR